MQLHQIEKFAPYMRHARSFANRSAFVELVEASECVRLQDAFELGQMPLGVLSLAIWRIGEPHGRRSSITRMQLFRIQHITTQNFCHWCQQSRSFAYPAGEDRVLQLDTFACEDLRLSIQRGMISELRGDDMRQQAGSGKAPINHALRRRRLHHAGTLPAAHLGARVKGGVKGDHWGGAKGSH
jgi:hypothetical protein